MKLSIKTILSYCYYDNSLWSFCLTMLYHLPVLEISLLPLLLCLCWLSFSPYYIAYDSSCVFFPPHFNIVSIMELLCLNIDALLRIIMLFWLNNMHFPTPSLDGVKLFLYLHNVYNPYESNKVKPLTFSIQSSGNEYFPHFFSSLE